MDFCIKKMFFILTYNGFIVYNTLIRKHLYIISFNFIDILIDITYINKSPLGPSITLSIKKSCDQKY